MQALSGNQHPDLLTSLMNMSLVLRLPWKMHLCRSSSNVLVHHCFWKCHKTLTFCSLLTRCPIPCACHAKRHLNVQKWSETISFLHIWLRNVLRATTACTFLTSQLLKVLRSYGVCTFWLRNVAPCTFSSSQLPKAVRTWCALYILTSRFASRHNGVQLFISHLASWLRTRRFSEPTFRTCGATNHWKNTVFRDLPTFSRICIFFLLRLSLLWSSLFYSSLLSDSAHLCFSSVHVVGSLTSKLLNFLRPSSSQNIKRISPVNAHIKKERELYIYTYTQIFIYSCVYCLSLYLCIYVFAFVFTNLFLYLWIYLFMYLALFFKSLQG